MLGATAILLLCAGQARAIAPAAPPLVAFPGLDSSQTPGSNPADVEVAASPGWVVETVNTSLAAWTTGGPAPQQKEKQQLASLLGREGDRMTDPSIVYDQQSGRFILTVVDVTRPDVVLAVSASGDPTSAWRIYPLASAGCPDQPRLGTSDGIVAVTADAYSACDQTASFLGAEVTLLSKPDLVAGATAPAESRLPPDPSYSAIAPVQSLEPSATQYLAAIGIDGTQVVLLSAGSPRATSLSVATTGLARQIIVPHPAPQAGSSYNVDTGDKRVQSAVLDGGAIWLSASETCSVPIESCVRVLELAPNGSVLFDSAIVLPGRRSAYFPALTLDGNGNAVVAFDFSSKSDFPGLGYTYIRPDGLVAPFAVAAAGTAPNESGRFGDYSGVARDPTDPSKIWIGAEIGSAVGGTAQGWATSVAAIRVPPQPPAVIAASPKAASGSATLASVLYPEGTETTYRFEYGRTLRYGAFTAGRILPASTRSRAVEAVVTGFGAGRTYHYRLVAENSAGRTEGPDETVSTPAGAPEVSYPSDASSRSRGLTTLRARVDPHGAVTKVVFQLGRTTAYGRTVGTETIGGAPKTVFARVRGLTPGRRYHFRAVATNARGQQAGADRQFRG
jgi:hypothetical protein